MSTKEEGRKNLPEVIERFKRWEKEGRLNNEDDVKDLIYELFEDVLGWNKDDIYRERHPGPTSKRADFQFKDKGVTKLILETKAIDVIWTKNVFRQAIGYGWSANKEYVVLSNFQSIILFNAKWKDENKKIFEIENIEDCHKFSDKFDLLWKLSKESFSTGEIDRFSEDTGKKYKKIPIQTIDKQLLNDLKKWREMLTKDIKILNNISESEIDEVIQKIINRLIFIRVCEDRGLEHNFTDMITYLRLWSEKRTKPLLEHLLFIFHHYDDVYDGTIFQKNDICENVKIHDNILEKIIKQLYTAEDVGIEYNFASIDADVLGSVYEEYLGYLLKGRKLTENYAHRKEQGIYYTPIYIVDYIIRNTLGELLKNSKEIDKIKVLDPACGSGSFLIKAFDIISEFYKEKIGDEKFNREVKNSILTNNLYGVDLDPKAVEIAQLNLFLKIGEKGELPKLRENVKCGNSLIDDENISEKAFKWNQEFEDIIKDGGFDVIIGNPPYVKIHNLPENEVDFYIKNFYVAEKQFDLFCLFIEKSLSLLKDGGKFGFIIPSLILKGYQYTKIREYIFNNTKVINILDLGDKVFENVQMPTCILILEKCSNSEVRKKNEVLIRVRTNDNINEFKQIKRKQYELYKNSYVIESVTEDNKGIINKFYINTVPLKELISITRGIEISKKHEGISEKTKFKDDLPIISGEEVERYRIKEVKFIRKKVFEDFQKDKKIFENAKLLIREIGSRLTVVYDDTGIINLRTLYNIQSARKTNISIKFLLGILNSKLMQYYYSVKFRASTDIFPKIRIGQVKELPIKIISDKQQKEVIESVDKMLSLNRKLNEIGDKKTSEREKVEEEIKKVDKEIDELVYKIYGITEEEKKIIEESME